MRRLIPRRALACIAALALAGCGGGGAADAGAARDGGPDPVDGGARDGGARADAGDADGGGPDAGGVLLPSCDALASLALPGDAPAPDSGDYALPAADRRAAYAEVVRAVAADRVADALARAADADVEVCGGDGLVAVVPRGRGRPRLVVRRGGAGPILEAPHPLHDTDTLVQARAIFAMTDAFAVLGAGTHRCATATPSGCDGRTGVCGVTDEPYRISDMAHVVASSFQAAHEALAAAAPAALVISVHGMGGDGVSLSDGTTGAVDPGAPVARLAAALVTEGIADVTSCNPGAGVPTVERLCGTTNAQGRHLNGALDPCDDPAASASGRFVHLEQSRAVRADPAAVARAIAALEAR